ncbi:hypothetical protein BDZ89DRAFT_948091, partial [Hymenopellis radicata]
LSNVEAMWTNLPPRKDGVRAQLEVLDQKSWKDLTIDEKKAAYYVSSGPHGARTPVSKTSDGLKVLGGVLVSLSDSAALFFSIRAVGSSALPRPLLTVRQPRKHLVLNKEWQEALNQQHAFDQKLNLYTF